MSRNKKYLQNFEKSLSYNNLEKLKKLRNYEYFNIKWEWGRAVY